MSFKGAPRNCDALMLDGVSCDPQARWLAPQSLRQQYVREHARHEGRGEGKRALGLREVAMARRARRVRLDLGLVDIEAGAEVRFGGPRRHCDGNHMAGPKLEALRLSRWRNTIAGA